MLRADTRENGVLLKNNSDENVRKNALFSSPNRAIHGANLHPSIIKLLQFITSLSTVWFLYNLFVFGSFLQINLWKLRGKSSMSRAQWTRTTFADCSTSPWRRSCSPRTIARRPGRFRA